MNLKVLPLDLSATDTTPPASQDRGLDVILPVTYCPGDAAPLGLSRSDRLPGQ